MELPSMVAGDPPARVLAYTPALALAEKAHACAMVGPRNTRGKDWHDLWACACRLEVDGQGFAEAIAAVFEHRGDAIPDVENCLTWAEPMAEFLSDRWKNWVGREKLRSQPPDDIRVVMAEIREFLGPAMAAAKAGDGHQLGRWTPGQGWGQSLVLRP
ncbi:hypothetical protein DS843_22600 [Roseomonas genomospecies 6]|uniref:Uncharacterized protein n=2 Tax=Roseomonas genomospecies 6 TaxID=214106 RepID=A0A9W7KQU0_9PROT|nr:hypothetical protein DS843_22600 [Roseomonas genomospecies 6]